MEELRIMNYKIICLSIIAITAITTESLYAGQVVYLFSHGIADSQEQARRYAECDVIKDPWVSFNYPDAIKNIVLISPSKLNFAQDNDIEALYKAYLKVRTDYPDHKIVLVGMSRGASTIITFLAKYQPLDIAAVVLESPFSSLETVLAYLFKEQSLLFRTALSLASSVGKYKREGPRPIDVIHDIPHTIPILFICSLQDRLVPASSTQLLYQRLCESGHPKAHILSLEYGKHAKIINGASREEYLSTIKEFYTQYGIWQPILDGQNVKI